MRRRSLIVLGAVLLLVAGVALFWRASVPRPTTSVASENRTAASRPVRAPFTNEVVVSESTSPLAGHSIKDERNNPLKYRLTNTPKTSGQLLRDDHAILLENALIDSSQPLGFQLPDSLQAAEEPGAYLVQARGLIGNAFRSAISGVGAEYVSYFPNNAWLVQATASQAQQLRANGAVQAVLPWEPVYKLKAELLALAMQGRALPAEASLNVLVYSNQRSAVLAQLQQLNAPVLAEDRNPFGSVLTVQPAADSDWLALARLGGVQILERAHARVNVNDLSRVRIGVAEDSTVETNYLNLTGTNVLVGINDSGVDATHEDFSSGRVFALVAGVLTDTDGHGTHVAGIIAGNGSKSDTVINARGSTNPGTNGQYRGVAPGAKLFAQNFTSTGTNMVTDSSLQENTARTNAFISNNSWGYSGNPTYSLAAASYDAAVRDSLPGVTGSQPVLYVFAAGNSGDGSDGGLSGIPGSVLSPSTAKNVISVGAIELARDITNIVTKISGVGTNQTTNTSTPWKAMTSSGNQVAGFSGRGNVGIGIEGDFGRFKPDVVAPGTAVISTRSKQWDEEAYYNPTNHHFLTLSDQTIGTNNLTQYAIFLPDNAVAFRIAVAPNLDSPIPFPDIPIYVRRDAPPTKAAYDILRTNFVSVPPDMAGLGGAVGRSWYYAIGNPTPSEINIDLIGDIITTNDLGDYFQVLSNLNNSISTTNGEAGIPPNYYRYESGTSMAAPVVSGTLALMQEYFQGVSRTNSPALMKALLINGARSVGSLYDFQVQSSINYQGWGLVKLNNSLQPGITNAFDRSTPTSLQVYEQSSTNALATGQSQTYEIRMETPEAVELPLRITLAWTDPAGNPAAGVKLVNDLDLIVTNRDTQEIFIGNDIPGSSVYTAPWDTNNPPNFDAVNNIENVYLSPALGTNYSITVKARRVNVNAVTAHPNGVVQDYALVISSGNGEVTTAFSSAAGIPPVVGGIAADVTTVSNSIVGGDFVASFLENQRVGANAPLLGTNNVTTNGLSVGITNQWKFYVVTNSSSFTNVAFLISQQTDLATPRMGVFAGNFANGTRRYADLDLYVSTDPNLTNLSPLTLDTADRSLSRNDISGDEYIVLTNAQKLYYVGVKSEDQQAGQFDFFAIFTQLPIGAEDANGFVRAYPMLGYDIPDGSPTQPGGTRFVALPRPSTTGSAETVRRVVITNNVYHENYGDIISSVNHNSRTVVLDNHRSLPSPPYPLPPGPYQFLYDDSGQRDFPNPIAPDGPGKFEDYMGERPGGPWYFTYSDDALSQVGHVNDIRIRLDRQCDNECELTNRIDGFTWLYFTKDVSVEATNLIITLTNITPTDPKPLELYVRKDRRPTQLAYDFRKTINPPGDKLVIDKSQLPPLAAGRYFIGVFNPNSAPQEFVLRIDVETGPPPQSYPFGTSGNQPLVDDAVNNSTIVVTNDMLIGEVDVGLRIDHPRVSDLAVTLISPSGTRVLLVENRGGTTTNGFGSSLTVTNFIPVAANGGPASNSVAIDTGATTGKIAIDYDFYEVPDQMTVYYEGNLLYDTGMISDAGRLNLTYGPGNSTVVEIRMNEFGNTNTSTAWSYTVSSSSSIHSYLTFTDNTNRATTPVKFALPPFNNASAVNTSIWHSSFESNRDRTYGVGQFVPDGWQVVSGSVDIIGPPTYGPAAEGFYMVDINGGNNGQIKTNIATLPGQQYLLSYAYARNADSITICGVVPKAQVLIGTNVVAKVVADNPTNTWQTLVWTTNKYLFTANSNVTRIDLRADISNPTPCGVLFDALDVSIPANRTRYVMPEESLKVLEGENAQGPWRLEILDTRTGAINNANLLSWQLQFVFQTNTALPRVLVPGVPNDQEIRPGQILYYIVDVPSFARFATNILFNATPPAPGLNFYFNQVRPPAFGATNVGDAVFALNAANHTEVLSTSSTVPPTSTKATLLPGQRYYLAIENPAAGVNTTFTIYVDFDLAVLPPSTDLTNGVPYCTTNPTPLGMDYYHYNVSASSVRAQFELKNLSGDMTLILRRGLPPTLAVFDYLSANVFTNDEVITVFDFSQPVSLTPGDWYFAAANLSTGPVSYCAAVREWAAYGTNIVITNAFMGVSSFCLTWTSLEGIPYFIEGVTNLTSTNWVAVSPTVYGTGYATTYCVPLPSPYQFFRVREGQTQTSYVPQPVITRIRKRFNGVEITWSGPPGQQYKVDWSSSLTPPLWNQFSETVTSATGVYQYLDDGSQTGGFGATRYYRLVLQP